MCVKYLSRWWEIRLYLCIILKWSDDVKFNLAKVLRPMKPDDFGLVASGRVQTLRSIPIKAGPLQYRTIVLIGALFLRSTWIFFCQPCRVFRDFRYCIARLFSAETLNCIIDARGYVESSFHCNRFWPTTVQVYRGYR